MEYLDWYIKPFTNKRFSWGANDCLHFVLGWLDTSKNIQIKLPKYKSKQEAVECIKSHGGAENWLTLNISKYLPEIDYNFAKKGDIVYFIDEKNTNACGIFSGVFPKVIALTETGIELVKPKEVKKTWSLV